MGEGATGEMAGLIGVDWRSANGLQSPHRAPMALCGSCDARDGAPSGFFKDCPQSRLSVDSGLGQPQTERLSRTVCSPSSTSRGLPWGLACLVAGSAQLSAEQLTGFRSGGRRVGGRPPTADGPPGSGMSHFHQVGSGHSRRSRRAEAPAPAVQNLAVQGPGVPFPLEMGRT